MSLLCFLGNGVYEAWLDGEQHQKEMNIIELPNPFNVASYY